MSELYGAVTLSELSRRWDKNQKITQVVNILNQKNAILDDIVFKPGTTATTNITTVDTSLPTPSTRKFNQGVPSQHSTKKQITDTAAMYSAYCPVDKKLAELNGNSVAFFAQENQAFVEGFGQKIAYDIFYANEKIVPSDFTGFAPRYSKLSTDEENEGYNIIDAGGTESNNTSIWLVNWGTDYVYGFYPAGSKAGFVMEDLGESTQIDIVDGIELRHQVLTTHYMWDIGLTVRNWKSIVRIANIDWPALQTTGDPLDSSCNLLKFMQIATDRVDENTPLQNAAFYMNPSVRSMLTLKIQDKGFAQLSMGELKGRQNILMFNGIPVRSNRCLLKTESRIV